MVVNLRLRFHSFKIEKQQKHKLIYIFVLYFYYIYDLASTCIQVQIIPLIITLGNVKLLVIKVCDVFI